MRFFRAMALKLRAQLLRLHGPTKEELKEEEDDSQSLPDASDDGNKRKNPSKKACAQQMASTNFYRSQIHNQPQLQHPQKLSHCKSPLHSVSISQKMKCYSNKLNAR